MALTEAQLISFLQTTQPNFAQICDEVNQTLAANPQQQLGPSVQAALYQRITEIRQDTSLSNHLFPTLLLGQWNVILQGLQISIERNHLLETTMTFFEETDRVIAIPLLTQTLEHLALLSHFNHLRVGRRIVSICSTHLSSQTHLTRKNIAQCLYQLRNLHPSVSIEGFLHAFLPHIKQCRTLGLDFTIEEIDQIYQGLAGREPHKALVEMMDILYLNILQKMEIPLPQNLSENIATLNQMNLLTQRFYDIHIYFERHAILLSSEEEEVNQYDTSDEVDSWDTDSALSDTQEEDFEESVE